MLQEFCYSLLVGGVVATGIAFSLYDASKESLNIIEQAMEDKDFYLVIEEVNRFSHKLFRSSKRELESVVNKLNDEFKQPIRRELFQRGFYPIQINIVDGDFASLKTRDQEKGYYDLSISPTYKRNFLYRHPRMK